MIAKSGKGRKEALGGCCDLLATYQKTFWRKVYETAEF